MSTEQHPNQDVPSLVFEYFGEPTDEPITIWQAYYPRMGSGWISAGEAPANWDNVFMHADQGATSFSFGYGTRSADFTYAELQKAARRSMTAPSAYPNNRPEDFR